jgi:hypothetical protein
VEGGKVDFATFYIPTFLLFTLLLCYFATFYLHTVLVGALMAPDCSDDGMNVGR